MVMVLDLLTILGLLMTALGAWIAARAVILRPEDAVHIGLSRYSSGDLEKDLRLPAVQNLLKSSRSARKGLLFVLFGTVFQIVPIATHLVIEYFL